MLKLMRLEAQRINLRVYFLTALILGGILLLFAYFTANAARVTGEMEFMNYRNILQFTCVISLLLFSILAAVMYNNVVIKEYSEKRLSLLFSYPSDRKKIFMAKIIMVFYLIFGLMLLGTVIPAAIFLITESFAPTIEDTITAGLLLSTFGSILTAVLFANTIGIFAMGIGFIKKSVTAALIAAFVLFGIYGNITIITGNSPFMALLAAGISIFAVIIILVMLADKIKRMEAD